MNNSELTVTKKVIHDKCIELNKKAPTFSGHSKTMIADSTCTFIEKNIILHLANQIGYSVEFEL